MKTLKTFKLIFIFTVCCFLSLACNEKRDVHNHSHYTLEPNGTNNAAGMENTGGNNALALGGESHGGDVLYARAEELRFLLTATNEEIDQKYLSSDPWHVRQSLTWVFQALRYYYNVGEVSDEPLNTLLATMYEGSEKEDIFYDINEVSFIVLMPPPKEERSFWKQKEKCRDLEGNVSTASAKLNDPGGTICVDAERLAAETPSLGDLTALLSHEFAHHFGADESVAHVFQDYVLANYDVLVLAGKNIEKLKERYILLDLTGLRFQGETIEFEIKPVFKDLNQNYPDSNKTPIFTRKTEDYFSYYAPSGMKSDDEYFPLPELDETKTITYSSSSNNLRKNMTILEVQCGLILEVKVKIGDFKSETFEVNGGRKCAHNSENWKPGQIEEKTSLMIFL